MPTTPPRSCTTSASCAATASSPVPQKAKQVRCDIPRVKEAIAAGRHVVCSLAPSFIADFRIRSLDVMADALKRLGFAEVQETAVGAQMVSDEYARIMREGKQHVLISSCCPSINMLIQKYYPTMLPHLARVLTPCRRTARPSRSRIRRLSPCSSAPASPRRPRPTTAPTPTSPSPMTSCATGWPPSISSCRRSRRPHRRQALAPLPRHRRRAQGHRPRGRLPPHRHRRRGQLPRRV